jgi:RNA polymerase sigma-70 factor (ECF subfamily)
LRDPWDIGGDPLEALRDGDPRPFEALVRARAPRLVGFFRRLGAGRAEAEDLTQDVFLKLYRNAARYRPQGTVQAYCLRVAHNAWIDRRRRLAARPEAGPLPVADGADGPGTALEPSSREASPGEALEAGDEGERLARAVAALPEGQAEVFELAVVQGLAYADVAAALEIPVGTVKSRVHHAVQRLRAALGRRQEAS